MDRIPDALAERLRRFGQGHVLETLERLPEDKRRRLQDQLSALDLELLTRLFERRQEPATLPAADCIKPIPLGVPAGQRAAYRQQGAKFLQEHGLALLVVAGGQGSRLGFDRPKGLFPVTPVRKKTLFQLHAEKVLALRRRYDRPFPYLVMTSPATHEETVAYFKEQKHFGLPAEEVHLIQQGTMPALDLETGRLLLAGPGRLFLSPNGHGGMLTALADSGVLDRLEQAGVAQLFYFQVDNPLIKVGDAEFLGQHLAEASQASSKAVPKLDALDRLGNLAIVDGRCCIIEYSDMPRELAERQDEQGGLLYRAGSPAIHLFALDFLKQITRDPDSLPFHLARKKVPHVDASGRALTPERENALKFERFIFDVLPLAKRWAVVETSRHEEFAPLKNAEGADSPAAVDQAQSALFAGWLEQAGVNMPRRGDSSPAFAIEISPLFALDADELAAKIDRKLVIDGPLYLE